MIINIHSSYDKVFKQYLTIVNGLLSSDKRWTNSEIDVLDKLLYISNLYKHLPKDKRDIILFHKTTRARIRVSLNNMSRYSFNNILTSLRKKGVIVDNSLRINVPIDNNKIRLEFNIDINDSEESSENIERDSTKTQ